MNELMKIVYDDPSSETYTIQLQKFSQRKLNDESLNSQAKFFCERILAAGRERKGWKTSYELEPPTQARDNSWIYKLNLSVQCVPKTRRNTYDSEFENIILIIRKAIKQPQWTIARINGREPAAEDLIVTDIPTEYYEITIEDDWKSNFTHLYGLDAHIQILHATLQASLSSNWSNRFHIVLYGSPGCGKSDLALSLVNMVGKDAVLEFDATATTMAGATKELASREEMPRILLVEEIEKADENSLRWLLGLMDIRGNIRKLTARNKVTIDTKLLCIATVNDIALFRTMLKGALASRFAHQLFCQRPNRDIMARILEREINKVSGDPSWINPTLSFCEKNHITYPRQAIAICLTGGDKLLSGEFQKLLSETQEIRL